MCGFCRDRMLRDWRSFVHRGIKVDRLLLIPMYVCRRSLVAVGVLPLRLCLCNIPQTDGQTDRRTRLVETLFLETRR